MYSQTYTCSVWGGKVVQVCWQSTQAYETVTPQHIPVGDADVEDVKTHNLTVKIQSAGSCIITPQKNSSLLLSTIGNIGHLYRNVSVLL